MTPTELLDTLVADVLANDPRCIRVFLDRGMACAGCPMARFETVAQVAQVYALDPLALAAALLNPVPADPAADQRQ